MNETEKDSKEVLERVKMFNDAVFAIALTLLVLELKIPEGVAGNSAEGMLEHLKEMMPRFMAFLLSIVMIGGQWFSSINIQRTMVRSSRMLIIYFILYLSLISVLPFCCNLIGNYPDNPISFVVFGAINMIIGTNAYFFMRHCDKANLYHSDVDIVEVRKLEKVIPIVNIFVAGMAALAFVSTKLSFGLFLVYNLIPFFATISLRVNHKTGE